MATVTCVLGLAGSGKTHHARALRAADPNSVLFDEIGGTPRDFEPVIEAVRRGQNCIVVEAALMIPQRRDPIIAHLRRSLPEVQVVFDCFEKDLVRANRNCWRRGDDKPAAAHVQLNQRLAPLYEIPPGARIIPVWEPEGG